MGASTPPPEFDGPNAGSHSALPAYGGPDDGLSSLPGPSAPLGVFATVRAALGLYGSDAVKLWQVIALVVIPVQALVFVLRAITVPGGSILQNHKIYLQPGTTAGGFDLVSALAELLAALALLVCVGATYRILLGRHLNHPADLSTSFSFALARVLPLLWVSILTAVLVLLGVIALIIGAIYLFVSFAIAVPVLMAEDRRGFGALARSRELISHHWWHVLGCVVVAAIVAIIGEVVIGAVAGAIVSGVSPHSVTGFLAISAIVNALISILFYPFTAAVPVVIYVDMLARKNDPHLQRLLS